MCLHHVFLFVCKNVFKDLCYTQISLIAFSECCTFISVSMLKLKSPTAATAIAEMTIRIRNEKSFHQIKYSICRAWKYKTYPDLGLAISFVTAVAPGARLPNGSHVAALLFWCYGAGAGGYTDTSNQEWVNITASNKGSRRLREVLLAQRTGEKAPAAS